MVKSDNSNTPVRENCVDGSDYDQYCNKKRQHRRQAISPVRDYSKSSFEGDTLVEDSVQELDLETNTPSNSHTPKNTSQITLEQVSELFQRNNKYILQAIQNTIQKEIENVLKDLKTEFKQNIEDIKINQITIEEKISMLEKNIINLEKENSKLQTVIKEIKEESNSLKAYAHKITPENQQYYTTPDYSKTIVLYGLNEYNGENDTNLEITINNAFMDIAEINLTGYVEELNRIGRTGTRRPIRIELISKRMATYILNNARCFRHSGLYVSKYLNKEALDERRKQRETYYNKYNRTFTSGHRQIQKTQIPNISNECNTTTTRRSCPEQNKTNSNHYTTTAGNNVPHASSRHSFRPY